MANNRRKKPAAEASGSSANVTVCQTGGLKEVPFAEGMTVEAAIKASGLSAGQGVQVRVDGQPVEDLKQVLSANQMVMLVGRTSGG